MKLQFTVDITVEVSDQAVADALSIRLEDLKNHEDFDELAIGQFGDLQLIKGDEPEGYLGNVTDYMSHEEVCRA